MPFAQNQPRSRASVAVGFVTGMLSGMAARRIDCSRALARSGIGPGELDDPKGRVPIRSYAALYNLAVHELSDEGFALFSAAVPIGSFEFLCRSVISSRTLAEALDRACRFLRLVVPDLRVKLSRGPGNAELRI